MAEIILFWISVGAYVFSAVAYIAGLTFKKDGFRKAGALLAACGLLFHTVAIVLRWLHAGHGPYVSTFEILSSTAWVSVLFFLLLQWKFRNFVNLGAAVMPLSFIMMGFAFMGSQEVRALPPTLRSSWLVVHVIFAKLTISSLLIAVAMSVFYLMKKGRDTHSGILAKLPSPAMLDDYSYRLVAFGFITLTIMIITGSIWANNSWGSYWSWDTTQTWSLVLWLVYGVYLHGRITFRWNGMVSAWYIILAFIFSVATFFIIPYFIKDIHSAYMTG